MIFCAEAFAAQDQADRFSVAVKAFNNELFELSYNLFEKFYGDFPDSGSACLAQLYMARCKYQTGDYYASRLILENLSEAGPCVKLRAQIYYYLAADFLGGADFPAAAAWAAKSMESSPTPAAKQDAQLIIAQADQAQGNTAGAIKLLLDILSQDTLHGTKQKAYRQLFEIYLQNKELDALRGLADQGLKENSPGLVSLALFYRAQSWEDPGEQARAGQDYRQALASGPDDAMAEKIKENLVLLDLAREDWAGSAADIKTFSDARRKQYYQGLYYLKTGCFSQACQEFDAVIGSGPRDAYTQSAALYKADALYAGGRLNDAIWLYQSTLAELTLPAQRRLYRRAWYGLAWCWSRSNDQARAIAAFRKAADGYGDDPIRLSALVKTADYFVDENQLSVALKVYAKALSACPKSNYADYLTFQKGLLFARLGKSAKTIKILDGFEKRFPASPYTERLKLTLGGIYLERSRKLEGAGRYREAADGLRAAIDAGLDRPDIRFSLALCLEKIKAGKRAIDEYLELAGRFPQTPYAVKALFRAAKLYEDKGDVYAAAGIYRRILSDNTPEAAVAAERLKDLSPS